MSRNKIRLGFAMTALLFGSLTTVVEGQHWNLLDSYKVSKQLHVLDVRKDQTGCGDEIYEHLALMPPSTPGVTVAPGLEKTKLTVRTCHLDDVVVDRVTHKHRQDCGVENNFKTNITYSGVRHDTDDHGPRDVIENLVLEVCYTDDSQPVQPDCQGRWYNKPEWQFSYNVTIPQGVLFEPNDCGQRFIEFIRKAAPYDLTMTYCQELGNTGAMRVDFQTEPLAHQRVVYQAVRDFTMGDVKIGYGLEPRCPYFNQVPMAPHDKHCSTDSCDHMPYQDFREIETV